MEPSSTRAQLLVALAVLVAALTIVACKRDSPEAQIRKAIDQAVAALANKDARQAGAALADDYVDDAQRGKQDLVRLAFFGLQRGPVFVKITGVETEVTGASATSVVDVLAVQGAAEIKSAADLLDTNARAMTVTLTWRKEGGDWRVLRIDGLPQVSF